MAWDKVYDEVTKKFDVAFVAMDVGYKTPWIAKKTLDDGKVPVLLYTRYTGNKDRYKPWEYTYDPADDTYTCPRGGILRHTATDREGKRSCRSTTEQRGNCPCKAKCGANEKGQAAMNLKKLAQWSWESSIFLLIFVCYCPNYRRTPAFVC